MTTVSSVTEEAAEPRSLAERVRSTVGSRLVLWLVVGLFAVQAGWIAIAGRLSIYDEQYHLQLIRDYARRWTPILGQDAQDGPVGDITRLNSYLYHYLMSFPWRLTEGLGDVQQLVVLRLITVAMVAVGLLVCARLFRSLGASRAVANVAVLVVSVSPLLVFVAATVNYDNLLFLVTQGFLLVAVRLYQSPDDDLGAWLKLVVLAGLGVLTKFSFAPLALAVVLVVVVQRIVRWASRVRAGQGAGGGAVHGARRDSVKALFTKPRGWALVVVTAIVAGAVLERYGGNLVRYGTPLPDCGQIQPTDVCRQWPPWARNETLDAAYPDQPLTARGAAAYGLGTWLPLMLRYASLIGVTRADGTSTAGVGPHVTDVVVLVVCAALLVGIAVAVRRPSCLRDFVPVAVGAVMYVVTLFVANYGDYRRYGQPVGIATRYVLILLPVVVCAACLGASRLLGGSPGRKLTAVALAVVVMTQGGGVLTFAYRADASWVWSAPAAVRIERVLGSVARHVMLPDDVVPDPHAGSSHG